MQTRVRPLRLTPRFLHEQIETAVKSGTYHQSAEGTTLRSDKKGVLNGPIMDRNLNSFFDVVKAVHMLNMMGPGGVDNKGGLGQAMRLFMTETILPTVGKKCLNGLIKTALRNENVLILLHSHLADLYAVFKKFSSLDPGVRLEAPVFEGKESNATHKPATTEEKLRELRNAEVRAAAALKRDRQRVADETMSLKEFIAIMSAAKLLGERQTRIVFATSQIRSAEGDMEPGQAPSGVATVASTVNFQASFVSAEPTVETNVFTVADENDDDDQNQLDFSEFIESLARVAIWKYHAKHPTENTVALLERVVLPVVALLQRPQSDAEKSATRLKVLKKQQDAGGAAAPSATVPGVSIKAARRSAAYF
jgi:hypothetical protein